MIEYLSAIIICANKSVLHDNPMRTSVLGEETSLEPLRPNGARASYR